MTGIPLTPASRIIFLGVPDLEVHVPLNCDWARTEFIPVSGPWESALSAAATRGADVTILYDPYNLAPDRLRTLSGLKIGSIRRAPSRGELLQLETLCSRPGGLDWVTWFKEPNDELRHLPVLQVLPPLVDIRRVIKAPSPAGSRVLMVPPAHASFAPEGDFTVVSPSAKRGSQAEVLATGGILLYEVWDKFRYDDALPILALASGNLLLVTVELPPEWSLEAEDEYLIRPLSKWRTILSRFHQDPTYYQAVRIRAWQKTRELFDASTTLKRMVQDALLLANRRSIGGSPGGLAKAGLT